MPRQDKKALRKRAKEVFLRMSRHGENPTTAMVASEVGVLPRTVGDWRIKDKWKDAAQKEATALLGKFGREHANDLTYARGMATKSFIKLLENASADAESGKLRVRGVPQLIGVMNGLLGLLDPTVRSLGSGKSDPGIQNGGPVFNTVNIVNLKPDERAALNQCLDQATKVVDIASKRRSEPKTASGGE